MCPAGGISVVAWCGLCLNSASCLFHKTNLCRSLRDYYIVGFCARRRIEGQCFWARKGKEQKRVGRKSWHFRLVLACTLFRIAAHVTHARQTLLRMLNTCYTSSARFETKTTILLSFYVESSAMESQPGIFYAKRDGRNTPPPPRTSHTEVLMQNIYRALGFRSKCKLSPIRLLAVGETHV